MNIEFEGLLDEMGEALTYLKWAEQTAWDLDVQGMTINDLADLRRRLEKVIIEFNEYPHEIEL